MIPVHFLNFNETAPDKGYWDMHFLETLFKRPEFIVDGRLESYEIVVIQGRNNVDQVDKINNYLEFLDGVLVIVSSDEESLFPVGKLNHPNMKLWLMTPHAGRKYPNVDRYIGEGYTPHCDAITELPTKDKKWFFAGQVTHSRRVECVRELMKLKDGELIQTRGFTQGIDPKEYIKKMSEARIIPCPGGPVTPDTFRMYEALEMACIPIVDAYAANNKNPGYWNMLFGEDIPFPIIEDWKELPGLIEYFNDTFQENSNKIFAWWQQYKQNFLYDLIEDFTQVTNMQIDQRKITVVIPTSPVSSNPDTSIIEETVKSIRVHLPAAQIIITFDGIRDEQIELKEKYQDYIKKVLWKMNKEWSNCYPIIFKKHTHQVGMMREALKHIKTDKVLYVEHDTPLTPDMLIDFNTCSYLIDAKLADVIRFHFEAFIPKEHEYLMLDKEPLEYNKIGFVRTIQWSQRPHLASTDFYRRILNNHFTHDAKTFIEDKMHSVIVEAYKREQLQGWNKFKIMIYHPEGGNIKRSYHTDGRAGEDKYSMTF